MAAYSALLENFQASLAEKEKETEKQLSDQKTTIAEQNSRIQELEARLEVAEKKAGASEAETKFREENEKLKGRIAELEASSTESTDERAKLSEERTRLEEQMKALAAERDEIEAQHTLLVGLQPELEEQKRVAEEEKRKRIEWEKQVRSAKSEREKFIEKIRELQTENQQKGEKLLRANRDLGIRQEKLDQLMGTVNCFQNASNQEEQEKNALQAQKDQIEGELLKRQAENEQWRRNHEGLRQQNRQLQLKLAEYEAKTVDHLNRAQQRDAQRAEMEKKLDVAQTEIKLFRDRNTVCEEQLKTAQDERNRAAEKLGFVEGETESLKKQCREMEEKWKEAEKKNQDLRQQIQLTNSKREHLNGQLQMMNCKMTKLEKDKAQLGEIIRREWQSQFDQMKETAERLIKDNRELEDVKDKLDLAEREIKYLKQEQMDSIERGVQRKRAWEASRGIVRLPMNGCNGKPVVLQEARGAPGEVHLNNTLKMTQAASQCGGVPAKRMCLQTDVSDRETSLKNAMHLHSVQSNAGETPANQIPGIEVAQFFQPGRGSIPNLSRLAAVPQQPQPQQQQQQQHSVGHPTSPPEDVQGAQQGPPSVEPLTSPNGQSPLWDEALSRGNGAYTSL